jgi:hypothetical protein
MIFLAILLLVLSPCFGQEIKTEKKDGVTIVHNPKKSAKVPGAPESLTLEEDLCIGIESGDEDYMFAELRSVQVDEDEDIIVLDWDYNVVKVYDKNGRHVRTFGKHGQGPGEIQRPSRMYLKGGKDIGILDDANSRFSYFSKEGECLSETSLGKHWMIFRAIPDSQGFIYGDEITMDGMTGKYLVHKFDKEFNLVKTVASFEESIKLEVSEPIKASLKWLVTADDRFVWAKTDEYVLHILDPSGKLMKKIIKDYERKRISDKEKEKITKEYLEGRPQRSRYKFVFPKHYPPIDYFRCDDEGRIYIRTFERDSKGQIKWDVFDEDGRYILSFFHPEEDVLFVIKNTKAYSMIMESEEEGIPLVKRYRMIWN